METGDLRTRLLAARAEIDRALEALDRPASPAPPPPSDVWMTAERYAQTRHLSVATVRRYCREGMPCVRFGHGYRIRPDDADAWLAAGGAVGSAERCGERQARRGTMQ